MKKTLYLLAFAIGMGTAYAQPEIDSTFGEYGRMYVHGNYWKQYSGTKVKASHDGVFVGGMIEVTQNTLKGTYSAFSLTKINSDGRPSLEFGQGEFVLSGTREDIGYLNSVKVNDYLVLSNDKVLVVGTHLKSGHQMFTSLIEKDGRTRTFNLVGELFQSLSVTGLNILRSGEVAVTGHAFNPLSNSVDFFYLKINQQGQIVPFPSSQTIVWADMGAEDISTDQTDSDGVTVTGYTTVSGRKMYVSVSFDENGNLAPNKKRTYHASTTGQDYSLASVFHPNIGCFSVGTSTLPTTPARDVVSLISVLSSGNYNTNFDYDGKRVIYIGGKNDRAHDVKVAKDGAIYIAGATQQTSGIYYPFVIRLFENGASDPSFGTNGVLVFTYQPVASDVALNYNVSLDLQDDGKVVVSAPTTTTLGRWVTRLKAKEIASPAKFTMVQPDPCDVLVKFTPQNTNGTHFWDFGDGTESSLASPEHVYPRQGRAKITHIYTAPNGTVSTYYLTDWINQAPKARTQADYMYPSNVAHTSLIAYPDPNKPYETNYLYDWSSPADLIVGHNLFSLAQVATYEPGAYPVTLTVRMAETSSKPCTITIKDTILVVPSYNACGDSYAPDTLNLGTNLVTNGGFDDATCPPVSFASQFAFKCDLNGNYEPEQAAIVSSYSDFEDTVQAIGGGNAWSTLGSLEGNFLVLSERTSPIGVFGTLYEKTTHRTAWSQAVYVEEGAKYRFKSGIANIANALYNYYTLPLFVLAVDDTPISYAPMHGGIEEVCGVYTATTTGFVTLKIIRQNGYFLSEGTSGIDNISFSRIYESSSAQARMDEESSSFSVSPSPASDKAEVRHVLGKGRPEHASIQVAEAMTGRVRQEMAAQGTATSLTLNNLENGVYIVRLFDGNGGVVGTSKLVVAK